MALPRHYIKLLPNLKEYALSAAPGIQNWQDGVFNDITEKGTKLTVEPLESNKFGERIGLCGDFYYCEAGIDREREDSIYIFKIESANHRKRRLKFG